MALLLPTYFYFNSRFLVQPWLASSHQSSSSSLFQKRIFWDSVPARCPSCHPTNNVKALKETHSTEIHQWPGLIFSLSAIGHQEDSLFSLHQLSNVGVSCFLDAVVRPGLKITLLYL